MVFEVQRWKATGHTKCLLVWEALRVLFSSGNGDELDDARQRLAHSSLGFVCQETLHVGTTSLLVAGTRYGEPVVAKVLHNFAPHWRDQFSREIAVYRLFEQQAPPVRIPRLIESDDQRMVLVLERLLASPMSKERHPISLPGGSAAMAGALTRLRRLAEWRPSLGPEWRVDYQTRLDRALRQGTLDSEDHRLLAVLLADALAAIPDREWQFCHGDLDFTNILYKNSGTGTVEPFTFVDWGSSASYLPGFDLALWWVLFSNMAGPRRVIDDLIEEADRSRQRAFLINLALLAGRELRAWQTMRPTAAQEAQMKALTRDWDHVRQRLREFR